MAKKKLQKALALLMAFSMTMSLLSVTAFAEGGEDSSEEAAEVVHEHESILCPTCEGTKRVKESVETCQTCGGNTENVTFEKCNACRGRGYKELWLDCPQCKGNSGSEGCGYPGCSYGVLAILRKECEKCFGTGEVPSASNEELCETCGGFGKVIVYADCQNCTTGLVDCPRKGQEFGKGVLVSVNEDGEGTLRYTCPDCGASYDEEDILDAEETEALIASHVDVTIAPEKTSLDVPAASAGEDGEVQERSAAGQEVAYILKVTNGNQVAAKNITVTVALDDTACEVAANPSANVVVDEETNTVTWTIEELAKGGEVQLKITAKTSENAQLGGNVQAELTAAMGERTLTSGTASVHINKYAATKTIYLAGANQGYHHGSTASREVPTRVANKSGMTLDDFENAVFSFDGNGVFYDYNIDPRTDAAGVVVNGYDGHIWRCVGFVPYAGYSLNYEAAQQEKYFFSESEEDGFRSGSFEEAQAYVVEQGGVLYGEKANEDNIHALENNLKDGYVTVMSVWSITKKSELEHKNYGELTIDPVDAVDYQPTSDGVKVEAGAVTVPEGGINGKHGFDCQLTITISADAPEKLHVNLCDALEDLSEKINAVDHNGVQPGDVIRYQVQVVNNSGKNYSYTAGSAAVGTLPDAAATESSNLGTGFEGYLIASDNSYCPIPRRVLNPLLKELGVTIYTLDDESIGKLLRARGYGPAEGEDPMTDAEITQSYLGWYYLDCLNCNRGEDEQATSFQDLQGYELAQLTNAVTGRAVLETCPDVAEGFYYFFYGVNYTFNGQGIYQCMAENGKTGSPADRALSAALSGKEDAILFTSMAGETTNNGFQNTRFGMGIQFDMGVTADPPKPTSDPGPGPSDDGHPVDDPTDIPEDPTPLDPGPQPEDPETPDLPDIPDEDVPLTDIPKTGDAAAMWLALSAVSAAGLFIVTWKRREKTQE